jgi:hypothetical protein
MHQNFEFIDSKGVTQKFSQYMATAASQGSFQTATINGSGAKGGKPLIVPYKGKDLSGQALKKFVF